MIIKSKAVLAIATLGLLSTQVTAGEFKAWSYSKKAGTQDVVVSFAGNGIDQEAMVDFHLPKGVTVAKAEVLVAGSVCVAFPELDILRAVPPSGAGKALPTKETDYCRFTLVQSGKGARAAGVELKAKFTECSAPGSEIKGCGMDAYDVSESR